MAGVPTVDLANPTALSLEALDAACRDHGFFLLAGHGLDGLIERTWQQTRRFFASEHDRKLGLLRQEGLPTGYYDQADAWRDPGVMAPRWSFALGLGLEQVRGVRIPDSYWEGLKQGNPVQWKEMLTKRILPGGCTDKTSEALDAVIAKYARFNPEPEQLGRYIVGILLGSPEFQRQ